MIWSAAWRRRNIVLIHNHWKNTAASLADLGAADWLNAERVVVVTPSGKRYYYHRRGGRLVALKPVQGTGVVAESDPVETAVARLLHMMQSAREAGNPAEMVMLQGERNTDITINTDSRLVREFLLNSSTVVFLEDVASEYSVEDPSFYSAMVSTIIYRELSGRGSLENADNPAYQSNFDWFKGFVNLFSPFLNPVVSAIDGDPSYGIGAINREALARIEQDAQRFDMRIYAPLLGYDIPTTLSNIPFSKGIHKRTAQSARSLHFVNITYDHQGHLTTVIPPSNEEHGAWRIELANFSGPDGRAIQQLYEPTLGYIAAEVAIAMQSAEYQNLGTDGERTAFLIAYHANRSAIPANKDYNPENFSKDTYREIRWAEDFEELVDEVKTEIQGGT